jgi:ApaG protein
MYLDEPSDVVNQRFTFGYAVWIENTGSDAVQLLRRRWVVRASDGSRQDWEGDSALPGHPVVKPGEAHVHDGSCTISSFQGTVEGNYLVQRADGDQFRVAAPSFPLLAAAN